MQQQDNIEVLELKATKISTNIELTWSTETETKTDQFVIEKSINEKDFYRIAVIEGAGYSTAMRTYYQYDTKPNAGKNYYRLIQSDINGNNYTYDVKMIVFEPQGLGENIIYKKKDTQISDESLIKDDEVDLNINRISGK